MQHVLGVLLIKCILNQNKATGLYTVILKIPIHTPDRYSCRKCVPNMGTMCTKGIGLQFIWQITFLNSYSS